MTKQEQINELKDEIRKNNIRFKSHKDEIKELKKKHRDEIKEKNESINAEVEIVNELEEKLKEAKIEIGNQKSIVHLRNSEIKELNKENQKLWQSECSKSTEIDELKAGIIGVVKKLN